MEMIKMIAIITILFSTNHTNLETCINSNRYKKECTSMRYIKNNTRISIGHRHTNRNNQTLREIHKYNLLKRTNLIRTIDIPDSHKNQVTIKNKANNPIYIHKTNQHNKPRIFQILSSWQVISIITIGTIISIIMTGLM